jgi:TATA-box binding protein (TBP) (component of TFIID and TFIIIB)
MSFQKAPKWVMNNKMPNVEKEWCKDVDEEWTEFLLEHAKSDGGLITSGYYSNTTKTPAAIKEPIKPDNEAGETDSTTPIITTKIENPICDDLYISTKTKVLFFDRPIDIHTIFWNIPVIEYWKPEVGIIKKQIKVVSKTMEEYEEYKNKIAQIPYYIETIIKQIDNPESRRIKFKDERKITVGISKKDVVNYRGKVKNAFYNCFALIYRIKHEGIFKEFHVKIFNTGKLEIPGVLNTEIFEIVKTMILKTIQPHVKEELSFIEPKNDDNILINSNFNCNFFIHREKLYNILRGEKYGIESAYDPCSYPGVKCKFYFNNTIGFNMEKQRGQILVEDRNMKLCELKENKKYTEISFMIFRTGNCLIVGNCSEKVLNFVFEFLRNILKEEYYNISVKTEKPVNKNKNTKMIKKNINLSREYFVENIMRTKTQ